MHVRLILNYVRNFDKLLLIAKLFHIIISINFLQTGKIAHQENPILIAYCVAVCQSKIPSGVRQSL